MVRHGRQFWVFAPLMAFFLVLVTGCGGGASTIEKGNLNAPQGAGFTIKTLANSSHRKYSVFIPYDYSPAKAWPVIVFLHGVGEGGSNATSNLGVGLGPAIADRASAFPFIVIFPQSENGYWNADSSAAYDAIAALHEVKQQYRVDDQRVYLTGLSTGGYGTWVIGAKYKSEFTALVPMCAFSAQDVVPQLKDIPVWAFHNSGDMFVLAAGTHGMVDAINKIGGNAKYTEYGALGHNCWDRAYGEGELFDWMLSMRKRADGRISVTPPLKTTAALIPAPQHESIQTVTVMPSDRAPAEKPRQPARSNRNTHDMPVW